MDHFAGLLGRGMHRQTKLVNQRPAGFASKRSLADR